MKVKLYTLGCKVNQYETQEITEELGEYNLFDDMHAVYNG